MLDELILLGWQIAEPRQQGSLHSIEFRHELTIPHYLSWHAPPTADDIATAIARTSEFDKIADAPLERPHAELIADIRGMGAIHGWTTAVINDLASILYRARAITAEEAEWLAVAGASWGSEPYQRGAASTRET